MFKIYHISFWNTFCICVSKVLPPDKIFMNVEEAGLFSIYVVQALIPASNLSNHTKASHTMTSVDPRELKKRVSISNVAWLRIKKSLSSGFSRCNTATGEDMDLVAAN